jgi:hypothetical protein
MMEAAAMTNDWQELLKVCIEDLSEGRRHSADHLPFIAASAGPALQALLAEIAICHAAEIAIFRALGMETTGPDNLWMQGIIADAQRDTTSTAAGSLLDIALIGAVRKAIVADLVSLETAPALADTLDHHDLADALATMQEQARGFDTRLQDLLHEHA